MFVAVWSGVLMPKTNNMAQFMNYYAKFNTVIANRDSLSTIPSPTHEGTTTRINSNTELTQITSIEATGNLI